MKKRIFLYLASQSERRRALLKKMGIAFQVVPSRYREPALGRGNPARVVMRHALGKARGAMPAKGAKDARHRCQAPFARHQQNRYHSFVLGADTLVFFRGQLIGKPKSVRAAEKLLVQMSGNAHWVYTGIALLDLETGKKRVAYDKTKVRFKKWGRGQIQVALKRMNPLDKAGAYAIQNRPSFVKNYRGSLSNVVGLPIELLRGMLRDMLKFKRHE